MAPKYKLTYFNITGIGEGLRFMLAYMEADFEDIRINYEKDYPTVKPTLPFGTLPLLEVDGKVLTQTFAIFRYLAKEVGLAGKDDLENLEIDMVAETINDLRLEVRFMFLEQGEEQRNIKKNILKNDTFPFYFKRLDAIVKNNGGYLCNKRLTWVDLYFTSLIESFCYACDREDVTVNYSNLKKLLETVSNLPQIKKYLEKRPKSLF